MFKYKDIHLVTLTITIKSRMPMFTINTTVYGESVIHSLSNAKR